MSPVFAAHIFADYLTVGRSFSKLDLDHGIWAVGGGIDFNLFGKEWGRVQLSGGSEGFYTRLTFGQPIQKNSRRG